MLFTFYRIGTKYLLMSTWINFSQVMPNIAGSSFRQSLDWEMKEGEVWTFYGKNGSGKSLLAQTVAGKHMLKTGKITYSFPEVADTFSARQHIKIIDFNTVFSFRNFKNTYYQQRFNSTESEEIPFVSEILSTEIATNEITEYYISLFNILPLLTRRINQLSSGELRRIIILKAIIENPQLLILDNPFTGLDIEGRESLNKLFSVLISRSYRLLFLVPSVKDIPECTTHILKLEKGCIEWSGEISDFPFQKEKYESTSVYFDWSIFPVNSSTSECDEIVRMNNIEIRYGDAIINKDINWSIKRGEKWALLGRNGSGKSTLLSYIFADNPQAYAKEIFLFCKRRGSGESIWDIKKRIGFTSSEMHLYYRWNVSCASVVASGFFDTIGLYRTCNEKQEHQVKELFRILNVEYLYSKPFLKTSSGEQRLILFMRTLVKNPELLILDEPFHGMDEERKEMCTNIISSYSSQDAKSLIYVTHRLEEIPACVKKVINLNEREVSIKI